MFKDVFAPKRDEKVLFLVDIPHDDLKDSDAWKARREMAQNWYTTFKEMGRKAGFSVDFREYNATGRHGLPIPQETIDAVRRSDLVLALTEYSSSSSLKPICDEVDTMTRCASMPTIEKRMEDTALRADYSQVKTYATAIEKMLNGAVGAEITFSTGDALYVDLRHRVAEADRGDCSKVGQFINFPSGEGCKVPYEATTEEIVSGLGDSRTAGIMPVKYGDEFLRYKIVKNRITEVIGEGTKAAEMRQFFSGEPNRANIAELGIGCNPKAIVSGNVLEDEKVGLHIAYGLSVHIGGKIETDVHQDIVFAKGCPIEGTILTLIYSDGTKIELIRDATLQYDLLK